MEDAILSPIPHLYYLFIYYVSTELCKMNEYNVIFSMVIFMLISEFVKNRRDSKTVKKYASELGISETQLRRIEEGYWDNPSPLQLHNFIKVFGPLSNDAILSFDNVTLQTVINSAYDEATHGTSSEVIRNIILNFYNNSKYKNTHSELTYLGISDYTPISHHFSCGDKNLNFGVDAVCEDLTSHGITCFYYVDSKRSYSEKSAERYINQNCPAFKESLLNFLLNDDIDEGVFITNNRSTFENISELFKSHYFVNLNKNITIAYCSSRRKGTEIAFNIIS